MKIRAVIFDVYTTILDVGPAPANATGLWQELFEETLGTPPPVNRTEFSVRTAKIIARQHATAKLHGVQFPEIQWPAVVVEAIPSLAQLSTPKLKEFLFRQMQIGRTLRLADGAEKCLSYLKKERRLLGIASNSQAYTLEELDAAFQGTKLKLSMFDPDLQFWSFANGFSKPNPHVFQILTARLEARGISTAETLMVGDRLDNDIAPARAFGWKTWQLVAKKQSGPSGNWHALLAWLESKR